jgi:hypothetical protein
LIEGVYRFKGEGRPEQSAAAAPWLPSPTRQKVKLKTVKKYERTLNLETTFQTHKKSSHSAAF